jgi:hypothetical protein
MRDYGSNRGAVRPESMGNYQLTFNNGVPFQFLAWNTPVVPHNVGHYMAAYVTDNWTPIRRLTVNLGARYANDNAFVPAQCKEAGPFSSASCIDKRQLNIWQSVAPRLFAAFDLLGNGKSVLKGGWGRFDHKRVLTEAERLNPYARGTTTYTWHDLNNDKLYQTGEVDLSLTGLDFVTQSASATAIWDVNEPQPKQDQLYAGIEHELLPNFGIRATGIYARSVNVPIQEQLGRPFSSYTIPVTVADPGPDGAANTGDEPGKTLTYWQYPTSLRPASFGTSWQTSLSDTPNHSFKTIEVAAVRRMSKGWQLTASYSATKKNIPFGESAAWTPNALNNTSDQTWEWIGRMSGAYLFPYGVLFSANYDSRSGTRQARTVLISAPGGASVNTIPQLAINAGPVGSLVMPAIRTFDVRAQKTFNLTSKQRFTVRLNIYNALNANTTTAWINRSGTTFLNPTAILPPRIMEIGGSFAF